MTQIQQARPRIANNIKSPKKNRNPIVRTISFCCTPSDRLAVLFLMGLVGMIVMVNIGTFLSFRAANESSSSGATVENTAALSNTIRGGNRGKDATRITQDRVPTAVDVKLPWLPADPMPPIDAKNRHPLDLFAMDAWAANPLVGSYVHRQDDEHVTRIHMPFMDLQSKYRIIPPKLGGVNSPLFHIEPHVMMPTQTFASPDCVVLTRKGNKFTVSGVRANQDRIAISDYVAADGSVKEFWMGLFDGHGELGHVVSHYAISEFPKRLEALRNNDQSSGDDIEATKVALKDIFLSVNGNMPNILGSGSTGISIWKRRDQLFISNVGDSMAFVVSVDRPHDQVKVVYTTKPHKPNDPLERQRIEGMGGQVQDPPANHFSARLMIPIGGDPPDVVGLAMSRSLGDFEGHPYGLIADPTTDVISINSLDPKLEYLVILASDGLLDRVTELDIARQMAQSQLLTPNAKYSPLEAAERLILQSSQAWMNDAFGDAYRDDISLAVHRLRI